MQPSLNNVCIELSWINFPIYVKKKNKTKILAYYLCWLPTFWNVNFTICQDFQEVRFIIRLVIGELGHSCYMIYILYLLVCAYARQSDHKIK